MPGLDFSISWREMKALERFVNRLDGKPVLGVNDGAQVFYWQDDVLKLSIRPDTYDIGSGNYGIRAAINGPETDFSMIFRYKGGKAIVRSSAPIGEFLTNPRMFNRMKIAAALQEAEA